MKTNKKPSFIRVILGKITSLLVTIVGAIFALPFVIEMMFGPDGHMTAYKFFAFWGFFFGAPMFTGGLYTFCRRQYGYGTPISTLESDVGRIRFEAETARWRNK